MNENDFYVAIQAILDKALESGWTLERVESNGIHAVEEFILREVAGYLPSDEEDE